MSSSALAGGILPKAGWLGLALRDMQSECRRPLARVDSGSAPDRKTIRTATGGPGLRRLFGICGLTTAAPATDTTRNHSIINVRAADGKPVRS